jgi:hypothetical protein
LASDRSAIADRLAAAEGYAITESGLRVFRDLKEPEWEQIGHLLRRRMDGNAWALGDWLVYGGGRHGSGGRWIGSSYERACAITGYSSSHMSNCYRVASTFPPGRRLYGLSFDHHRSALALVDEIRIVTLQSALEQGLSSQDFGAQCGAAVQRPPRAKGYKPVEVECPSCHHRFPARANRAKEVIS